ncbi:MAG: alkaline phosphatase family protein [Peptococcaceae bacterium]|nr:alkaline phosphatase family protein [Peptococcaceae bacterium]
MKAKADKIFVLGIDGLDPRYANYLLEQGKMPNLKKLMERGSYREDLVMLGGQPTVTPPMWATMSTGAYPVTHGITCYFRQPPFEDGLDVLGYNQDSRNCKAEAIWDTFVEAGKKTLVWHWPANSWPPTSDSPLLHVVDGTQPAVVNMGIGQVESEFVYWAKENIPTAGYREKIATDSNVPCAITDMDVEEEAWNMTEHTVDNKPFKNYLMDDSRGSWGLSSTPYDMVVSPVKPAVNWAYAPEDAKECTMLFSKGLIHRPCLIVKNEAGIYDKVLMYKNKKAEEPIVVLEKGVFTPEIIDEAIKKDVKYTVNRSMRILEMAEDGSAIKIWVSAAMDINNDMLWHPKHIYKDVCELYGYPPADSMLAGSRDLIVDCMKTQWDHILKWTANCINHLIKQEKYDAVFSQFHSVDAQGHMIMKFLKNRYNTPEGLDEKDFQEFQDLATMQADDYIGEFLYLLDEGWTVILVSDHGQVCPEHKPHMIGDGGTNIGVMRELGFTVLKQDENGNDLEEIDWTKTVAIAQRMNHIYINLKGRTEHGIVDPEDQYDLEEKIMTALYGYRDKETGYRTIALALRNRDAVLLGMGGPESGDIIYWTAEGFNNDHADSLSTTYGCHHTSVSPIFVAAGPGFKENFITDRIIRQVDLVPTIAMLAGVRMPAQCEGAPIYQIMDMDF